MHTKEEYIAVFDSGVGGISVLRELVKMMPEEKYLYFGDSANAPYGSRTTEEVRQLTLAAAEKLTTEYPIKALVIACNTATAAAICDLRNAYPDTIIIGIEPALKLAYDRYGAGRVGVMATQVTLREEKFSHQLERFPDMQVSLIPAPGLVELIEAGKADSAETEALLRELFAAYPPMDALVLGCTHYPFAAKAISRVLGPDVTLLEGGDGTARETRRRLAEAGLLNGGEEMGTVRMEHSGSNPHFAELVRTLME